MPAAIADIERIALDAVAAVETAALRGDLRPSTETFRVKRLKDVQTNERGRIISYSPDFRLEEVAVYHHRDRWSAIESVRQSPAFDAAVWSIVAASGWEEPKARFWLTQIIFWTPPRGPDDSAAASARAHRLAAALGQEWNGDPAPTTLTFALTNVELDSPEHRLADGLVIRRVTPADLETRESADLILSGMPSEAAFPVRDPSILLSG